MRYLIGFDIDGTLVNDESELTAETIDYIKKLSNEGHIVSLITGRPFRTTKELYEQLELKTPVGNYSGSSIHNPNDENFELVEFKMEPTIIKDLMEKYGDHIQNGFCEIEERVYLFKEDEGLIDWLRIPGGDLIIGSYDIEENISGSVLFVDANKAQEIEDFCLTYPNLGCRYWRSLKADEYSVMEIYTTLSSKAKAMEVIREYYDIPKENTIALGDGTNDVEMLEYAHYSASMKNAPKVVRDAAKHEAGSNNENGAIEFVKRVLNNEL